MITGNPFSPALLSQRVSVIICAYTEERWTELTEALASMSQQSRQPDEVIVVIDYNLRLLARTQSAFPRHTVLANTDVRGLSGARNTGIRAASGDILAFMDEDAVAEPDWLERLLNAYQDPQVIGVGGAIQPWWVQGKPAWFPEEFNWVVGCTYRGMPVITAPVRNLIGCNMSFRREVFERAGAFTNGMGRIGKRPLGCEETELCIRATQKLPGRYFLYAPQAVVRHRVPSSRATWTYFFSRCYSEGLSKAQVAQLVGAQQGLSNERTYTFETLPKGVLANLGQGLRGHWAGFAGAFAIIAGLLVTTWGYLVGKLLRRGSQRGKAVVAISGAELLPTRDLPANKVTEE
jgi:glucosyl-dolichyl phosphate glucuronosyltransferase